MAEPAYKRAGFDNEYAYRRARIEARRFAAKSNNITTRWRDDLMKDPENFRVYYWTFVSGATGSRARRQRLRKRKGRGAYMKPTRDMKRWIVDIAGIMSSHDFDRAYSELI